MNRNSRIMELIETDDFIKNSDDPIYRHNRVNREYRVNRKFRVDR